MLETQVPNDGSQAIVVPLGLETSSGRIMVKGSESIFFDINDRDISVKQNDFILTVLNEEQYKNVCVSESDEVEITLEYKTFNDFNESVNLSASTSNGIVVTILPTQIDAESDTVTVTLTELSTVDEGMTPIIVTGNSESLNVSTEVVLNVSSPSEAPVLNTPVEDQSDQPITVEFTWTKDESALFYTLQVAKDKDFDVIALEEKVYDNFLTTRNLEYETQYYWRVKTNNSCDESSYSRSSNFTTEIDRRIYIPDNKLEEELIKRGYDYIMDDYILKEDATKITNLNLSNLGIENLTGLEAFVNLYSLNVSRNSIFRIELDKYPKLTYLNVGENNLSEIDVSTQTKLTSLIIDGNNISNIDLSQNIELRILFAKANKLSSIDLSKNTKLYQNE